MNEPPLSHYLDRMRAKGGEPPARDAAWHMIAVGIVYGTFLWAITLKVDREVIAAMLERLGAAVADHDAYASVFGAAAAESGCSVDPVS